MPKLPVFTAKGTITTETGSTQTNIQMGLDQNLASALDPITKKLTEYKIKEKNAENKTEALELENNAVVELNGYVQEASNMKDSDKANNFLMEKSKLVRNKFESQASNSNVKTIFANNYLMEEQKKIYSVDNAVHKNLINSRALLSAAKEERVMTDALYPASGDNSMALATIKADLTAIHQSDFDDGMISITEYESKVANIPNKIDYFKVKKDSVNDPVGTYAKLSTGQYENLNLDTREDLLKSVRMEAVPILNKQMTNYIAMLENGDKIDINETAIKEIFGVQGYQQFKQTEGNTIKLSVVKDQIFNSKSGEEEAILDSWNLTSGNEAQDLEYKQKARNFLIEKNKLIETDAASLVIKYNSDVQQLFEDYQNEPEGDAKNKLFQKYVNSVVQTQKDMDIDSSLIKVVPEKFAKNLVRDYQNQEPLQKIGYLIGLEEQYGDEYGRILNQMSANGLPVTAKLVSYIGDENFATKVMSIDTKEEKAILNNYLKTNDIDKAPIELAVAEQMKQLRDVVMLGNKMNTTRANKELNDMQEIITYVAINSMSSNSKLDFDDAVKEATAEVLNNFVFAGESSMFGDGNTYFIPRKYNNDTLSDGQIRLIERKAETIKEKHLEDFDMFSFKSKFEDDDKILNEEMLAQAKQNGIWVNAADGSGIVFAIPFPNGELALVENKKGELLKINFDDGSHILPTTNVLIDLEIYDTNKVEEQTP